MANDPDDSSVNNNPELEESEDQNTEFEEADEISLEDIESLINTEDDDEDSDAAEGDGAEEAEEGDDEDDDDEDIRIATRATRAPKAYKDLSWFGKIVYRIKAVFAPVVRVFDEFLYFLGGIEHGIRRGTRTLFQERLPSWGTTLSLYLQRLSLAAFKSLKTFVKKKRPWEFLKDRRVVIALLLTPIVIAFVYFVGTIHSAVQDALKEEPFLQSFETVSDMNFSFEDGRFESFYSNPRFAAFSIELPKMVVNLKSPDRKGYQTSLAAFEFVMEVSSARTKDEIDRKKPFFTDLTQRIISEYTYKDLVTPAGKLRLRKQIREEINVELKSGRVKHIYLNTVILRP